MKALLLGLVLGVPFIPLMDLQEETTANLALMPAAATGISHGYALWATGQIENAFGCIYGSAHPQQGVEVQGAGVTLNAEACAAEENAIGMLLFTHEEISQEQVCEAARVIRAKEPQLILFATIHGLEIHQATSGLDFASPRAVWCATPIEAEQFYRPPQDQPPASTT
jgi:hypothetical protein